MAPRGLTYLVLDAIKARPSANLAWIRRPQGHPRALSPTWQVLAFFVTGPYLILRLPAGPLRAIVRNVLRPIHKPLGAILG